MSVISTIARFSPIQVGNNTHPGAASRDRLMAEIKKANPDKADALSRQYEDSKSLAKQMEALRKGMKDAPKADAAQRVARIKEEIRMLQMMGGDPKLVAHRVAQLARELGQAAKTYAAASSGSAAMGTGEGDVGGEGVSATAANGAAGNADGAAANVASDGVNRAAAIPESETAATAEAPRPALATTIAELNTKLDDYRQSHLAEARQKIIDSSASAEEAQGDRRFQDEVRELAAKLRALAEKAARALKQMGDDHNPDIAATKQGLSEIEHVSGQIAKASGGVSVSVFA